MTAADQIRALADTGTPGPLREASWAERGLRTLRSTRDDVWLADVRDHGDAAKIVAAVNALPKVADYDEAVMAYLNHQTVCGVGSSCPELVALWQALVVARGVLVAALGVTA